MKIIMLKYPNFMIKLNKLFNIYNDRYEMIVINKIIFIIFKFTCSKAK